MLSLLGNFRSSSFERVNIRKDKNFYRSKSYYLAKIDKRCVLREQIVLSEKKTIFLLKKKLENLELKKKYVSLHRFKTKRMSGV